MAQAIVQRYAVLAAFAVAMIASGFAHAEMSAEELAKLAQNPVGNLISVPFQNNTNLNFGPEKGTQNILNIQPVIPISVSPDWNIITRTIMPVIWDPALGPDTDSKSGLRRYPVDGVSVTRESRRMDLGRGPDRSVSDEQQLRNFGNKNWGAGAVGRGAASREGQPLGIRCSRVNNVGRSTSDKQGGSYSNGLIQPFLNYNFEGGFYLTTAPIATVDWKAESSQQWTVPIGGGVGKIFHFGKLPVNTQISAYYNVVKPDFGANWGIRAQVQLMFPK